MVHLPRGAGGAGARAPTLWDLGLGRRGRKPHSWAGGVGGGGESSRSFRQGLPPRPCRSHRATPGPFPDPSGRSTVEQQKLFPHFVSPPPTPRVLRSLRGSGYEVCCSTLRFPEQPRFILLISLRAGALHIPQHVFNKWRSQWSLGPWRGVLPAWSRPLVSWMVWNH